MTVLMSELSWTEYAERLSDAVVLIPVGALEQHGTHLPLATDSIQALAMAEAIAKQVNGIVCPPITYGYKSLLASGGGQTFPGTTSLSAQSLIGGVKDILRELIRHGARRIVLFDGHFENGMFLHEAMDLALAEERNSDVRIMRLSPGTMHPDTVAELEAEGMQSMELEHAGLVETSLMLYLRPDLVHMERTEEVPVPPIPAYEILPEDRSILHHSGSLSTPVNGRADLGKKIFDELVTTAVDAIRQEL